MCVDVFMMVKASKERLIGDEKTTTKQQQQQQQIKKKKKGKIEMMLEGTEPLPCWMEERERERENLPSLVYKGQNGHKQIIKPMAAPV